MALPQDTRVVLDWSMTTGLTYARFLQTKEDIGNAFRFAIDAQTQALIASNEQLQKRGLKTISTDMRQGFSILSRDIHELKNAVHAGTAELVSAIRWGLSVLAIAIRQMNDTLQEIKRILQNPNWTNACEWFAKAREEYDRGLYPEALKTIGYAIDGYSGRPGWDTEFRFYFLRGRILIGSWIGDHPNTSSEIVDPARAEEAFLLAARYHRGGGDTGKAQALLYAGRAAFYQREVRRAIQHTETAVRGLAATERALTAAGSYQVAKYLCAEGNDLAYARKWLAYAADRDLNVLIDAAADHDFLATQHDVLDRVISDKTEELRGKFDPLSITCKGKLAAIGTFTFDGMSAATLLAEEVGPLKADYAAVLKEAENGGVLDLDSAVKMIGALVPKFTPLFGQFKERFTDARRREWNNSRAMAALRDAQNTADKRKDALSRAQKEFAGAKNDAHLSGWRIGCGAFFLLLALIFLKALLSIDPTVLSKAGPGPVGADFIYFIIVLFLWFPWIAYALAYAPYKSRIHQAGQRSADAEAEVRGRQAAADRAWEPIQRKIDELNQMTAPF